MNHTAIESGEHLVVDLMSHEHRTYWHHTTGKRLCDQDHVGFQFGNMLVGEELAGTAHTGLDFVNDEQSAVLAAEFLGAQEEFIAGWVDALALDGFDHKARGGTSYEGSSKGVEISVGNIGGTW